MTQLIEIKQARRGKADYINPSYVSDVERKWDMSGGIQTVTYEIHMASGQVYVVDAVEWERLELILVSIERAHNP